LRAAIIAAPAEVGDQLERGRALLGTMEGVDTFGAPGGSPNLVSVMRENLGPGFEQGGVVVDHQDPRSRSDSTRRLAEI
jgi:hypothetical protein